MMMIRSVLVSMSSCCEILTEDCCVGTPSASQAMINATERRVCFDARCRKEIMKIIVTLIALGAVVCGVTSASTNNHIYEAFW